MSFRSIKEYKGKEYSKDQYLSSRYMTSSKWHQQESSSGQQVSQRLDHSLSQARKHVGYNFVQVWLESRECSRQIKETFYACFFSKPLWSLFFEFELEA